MFESIHGQTAIRQILAALSGEDLTALGTQVMADPEITGKAADWLMALIRREISARRTAAGSQDGG